MKSKVRFVSLVVALTLLLSVAARASNEELGYGARGISMGHAQTAACIDYTALFYNPATLGFARDYWGLARFQPLVQISQQGSTHDLYLNDVNQQEEWSPSIAFGMVLPVSKRLTIGTGLFLSTDSLLIIRLFYGPNLDRWRGDHTFGLSYGFAYQVTKKLYVGYTSAGQLAYNSSELQLDIGSLLSKVLGLNLGAGAVNVNPAFELDIISANSYDVGALYTPFDWLALGINYKYRNPSPLQIPIKVLGGGLLPDFNILVDQPGLDPTIVTGGISVKPIENLVVAADLSYALYSLEHTPGMRLKSDSPLFADAGKFKRLKLEDVYIPKFGVEWKDNFRGRFERIEYAVRGGYQYYPSPYPPVNTKRNMAGTVDNDAHYYTGGLMLGYRPLRGSFIKGPAYIGIEYFYEYIHLVERTSREITRNPPVIVSEGHVIYNGFSLTAHW